MRRIKEKEREWREKGMRRTKRKRGNGERKE
jgi:hypothetical protein